MAGDAGFSSTISSTIGCMPDEITMPVAAPVPPLAERKLHQCGKCNPGVFRRINRASLLERTVFTWLGFYPWECVSCRRKRYLRDQGRGGAGAGRI